MDCSAAVLFCSRAEAFIQSMVEAQLNCMLAPPSDGQVSDMVSVGRVLENFLWVC